MSLLIPRTVYKPFEYPQAFEYFMKQQQAHWLWTDINMSGDIKDFNEKLTEHEQGVIVRILQLFTATELLVGEYWSDKVVKFFPKPEIAQMALTFAGMETIHVSAYDYLNTSLGLAEVEHQKILTEPALVARQEKISNILNNITSTESMALALAVFSGFVEGVNLFSSFAALMNYSRFNKMKGVMQIVRYSSKDESLHSDAGCWLFRTLMHENPDLWTDDFKRTIYQAARDIVDLEDSYIDYVFQGQEVEGLSPKQLKAYIRFRADTKLQDLGLKRNWKNLNMEDAKAVSDWYDMLVSAQEHTDFFSQRPSNYSKGHVDWSKISFTERKYS
jgi:ribonucleoside-diphosphate reductase beta chain